MDGIAVRFIFYLILVPTISKKKTPQNHQSSDTIRFTYP